MSINNKPGLSAVMKAIREHLTLEDLAELYYIFKGDIEHSLDSIIEGYVHTDSIEYLKELNDDDLANCRLRDYIGYLISRDESPKQGIIDTIELLMKSLLPVGGFITGDFESISFEQIPQHPIARITFSEKKTVSIKAKNNVLELQL